MIIVCSGKPTTTITFWSAVYTCSELCTYISMHIHAFIDCLCFCIGSGNYTNCWGKSGSPVVTSSEVDDHVILTGIANYRERKEQNMCSSSVPYGVHTKMDDGLQQWIGDHVTA